MKFFLIFLWSALALNAFGKEVDTRCSLVECDPGSTVITYFKKVDPYYACHTMELSRYVNYVIGLASSIYQLSGRLPNISPVTGDPEQTGKSKELLDALRGLAKIKTFDQALASCSIGSNKLQLIVANNPKDERVMWVSNPKTKEMFWMPKSHLNKLVR